MKKAGNSKLFFTRTEDEYRISKDNFWKSTADSVKINTEKIKNNIVFNEEDKHYYIILDSQAEADSLTKNQEKKYVDFSFMVYPPYKVNQNNVEFLNNLSLASKLEGNNKINFFNKDYNEFSKKENIKEENLLNYYIAASKDVKNNEDIEKLTTNGYRIDDFLFHNFGIEKYFKDYSSTYELWKSEYEKYYSNKLKKLVFNPDKLPSNNESSLFPNTFTLLFNKETTGQVLDAVNETKMDRNLLFVLSKQLQKQLNLRTFSTNFINSSLDKNSVKKINSQEDLKYFDFSEWVKSNTVDSQEKALNYFDFSNNEALLIGSNEQVGESKQQTQFLSSLLSRVLAAKAQTIINNNLRNYKEVTEAKSCYSEVLGIKIEKFKENSGLIQTYIIQNTKEDILSFVDSQIIENKVYTYKVSYLTLVVGNEYSYEPVEVVRLGRNFDSNTKQLTASNFSKLKVINTPKVLVFDIPLTSEVFSNTVTLTTKVVTPPVAPIITPIPFKDSKSKIKFNFQRAVDKYSDTFYILESEDEQIYKNLLILQDKTDGQEIVFGESFPGQELLEEKYEIFKIDKLPKSILDFKDNKLITINSTSFLDTLEFNKKTYYLFRSVGPTGLKSNVTSIYEIEIIFNSGIVYPVIKTLVIEEKTGLIKEKVLKKYLYLSPAYQQTLLDQSEQQTAENPKFGVGPKVWDKAFKIRVTSKKTGRKIDVNFTMKIGSKETLNSLSGKEK